MSIPFNAHVISNGESPFTTEQTTETESPQFTALSAISKGAMRGGTVEIYRRLTHRIEDRRGMTREKKRENYSIRLHVPRRRDATRLKAF